MIRAFLLAAAAPGVSHRDLEPLGVIHRDLKRPAAAAPGVSHRDLKPLRHRTGAGHQALDPHPVLDFAYRQCLAHGFIFALWPEEILLDTILPFSQASPSALCTDSSDRSSWLPLVPHKRFRMLGLETLFPLFVSSSAASALSLSDFCVYAADTQITGCGRLS